MIKLNENLQIIITKILCIIAFILLTLSIFIIKKTPPSVGYELSIYTIYPISFWIALVGSILIGILIILREIFSEIKTKTWIIGLFIILIGNIIFLLLPYFRGYPIAGGANADIFTHIGWIREISQSGNILENNFYPVIHIFTKFSSDALGISINQVLWFIPLLFSIIYVLFMYLLAKVISKSREEAILITLLTTPLVFSSFHISITPSFFSFMFLPLLIFFYHKRNTSRKKTELTLLIFIFCFFIVFFHPMTSLFAMLIFLTFIGSEFLIKILKKFNDKINAKSHNATNILLILFVAFFAWYTSHGEGLSSIKSIFNELTRGSEQTIADYYTSTLSMANLSVFQILRLLILRYGSILLYGGAGFIALLIVAKRFFFSKKYDEIKFSYGLQLISAFFMSFLMIFSYLIVTSPIRASRFFLLISTILIGLVFYSLVLNSKINKQKIKRYLISLFLVIFVISSSFICILNLHSSPNIWQPNNHFTQMNFDGSTWLVENRDIDFQISNDFGFNLLRIEHYINGIQKGDERTYIKTIDTPSHFGYDHHNNLFNAYNNTVTYLITTKNGRAAVDAFPDNVRSKVTQYTNEDFLKLNSDFTVKKIFDNGEFECWLIGP